MNFNDNRISNLGQSKLPLAIYLISPQQCFTMAKSSCGAIAEVTASFLHLLLRIRIWMKSLLAIVLLP
jgi:hypothetical protein